jgi:hypothetical protein
MGYDTTIIGEFTITPPLKQDHATYLAAFADTRRVKRDPVKAALLPDPIRTAVGLPVGDEGEFVVGGTGGSVGEEYDDAVVDGSCPPGRQPRLWCGWSPSDDGHLLIPNDDYNRGYLEWLDYLTTTFLRPWGYKLTGRVSWQGDDPLDRGVITAAENGFEVAEDELEEFEHIEIIRREVDEFRELLATTEHEEELHQFLKNSEILLRLTSSITPLSKFPLGSDFVTDFVIREIPEGYILVEIERAGLRLFNKPKKAGYPPERSHDFNHAIEQTESWRSWVGRNHAYVSQKLPGISTTPMCWLIAGRRTPLTDAERHQLERYNDQYRHLLRVWTYDDFLERVELIVSRLTGG